MQVHVFRLLSNLVDDIEWVAISMHSRIRASGRQVWWSAGLNQGPKLWSLQSTPIKFLYERMLLWVSFHRPSVYHWWTFGQKWEPEWFGTARPLNSDSILARAPRNFDSSIAKLGLMNILSRYEMGQELYECLRLFREDSVYVCSPNVLSMTSLVSHRFQEAVQLIVLVTEAFGTAQHTA